MAGKENKVTWIGWYLHEYGTVTISGLAFVASASSALAAWTSLKLSSRISKDQALGNHRRIQLDLFEKRYEIYTITRQLLVQASNSNLLNYPLDDLRKRAEQGRFLFGVTMGAYLDDIVRTMEAILKINNMQRQSDLSLEKPTELGNDQVQRQNQLAALHQQHAEMFTPFLQLPVDSASRA